MSQKFILVGKAASGKDFLRKKMVSRGLVADISVTTRPKRTGEIEGVDYFYISEQEFEDLQKSDCLYESVRFNGWSYGTLQSSWETSNIFIMTPTGVSQISPIERPRCFVIFLDIPIADRVERLLQRSDSDSVERRLAADYLDFKDFTDYDIRITTPRF